MLQLLQLMKRQSARIWKWHNNLHQSNYASNSPWKHWSCCCVAPWWMSGDDRNQFMLVLVSAFNLCRWSSSLGMISISDAQLHLSLHVKSCHALYCWVLFTMLMTVDSVTYHQQIVWHQHDGIWCCTLFPTRHARHQSRNMCKDHLTEGSALETPPAQNGFLTERNIYTNISIIIWLH